jgi:uncharacterized protein involved in exopolysaccharide biosynthesis
MGFRRRKVLAGSFVFVLFAAISAAIFLPKTYESEMRILVRKERVDPVVSAADAGGLSVRDLIMPEELNSEIELIRSDDVLRNVVLTTGMHTRRASFLRRLLGPPSTEIKIARAVRTLAKKLEVEPLKKSNIIAVRYSSSDPAFAAHVLNALSKAYLDKHMQVRHTPRQLNFFEQETEHYRQKLAEAEARLAAFPREGGAVAGQLDRDIAVQKLGEMKMNLSQTQATIAETRKRIASLEAQIPATPARITTQVRNLDNAQLLEKHKSTLLELELKRTQLLQKYKPTYRLVRDVEEEIAKTRVAIAAAESSPLRDEITDRDPTYEWMRGELAKARTERRALEGRAAALTQGIVQFDESARSLHASGIAEQELMRAAKVLEEKYQLYLKKQEEARIADAMDRSRILNVDIAQEPTMPVLPTRSFSMFLLGGILLAMVLSAGAVFVAEYLDPSFRTPEEVQQYLSIPLLAALPKSAGQTPNALAQ